MFEPNELDELEQLRNDGYRWLECHKGIWFGYTSEGWLESVPDYRKCYGVYEELKKTKKYFIEELLEGDYDEW